MTNSHPPIDPVQLAMMIRRGQIRLRDIPAEHQAVINSVLHRLTDAQESQIAFNAERKTKQLGRSTVHSGRALS